MKSSKKPPPYISASIENNTSEYSQEQSQNYRIEPMLGQTQKNIPKPQNQNQNKNDDFLDPNPNLISIQGEIKSRPKPNVNIMDLFSFDDNNKKEETQHSLPTTGLNIDNNPKLPQRTSNMDFLDMDSSSKPNQNNDAIVSNTTQTV